MAAVELAESIKSFASNEYVAGAMHLVAMAAFIAAAVQAGSELGGGSPKQPTAGTFIPAQTEPQQQEEGGGGTTTINNYSLGRSNPEAGEAIADLEYDYRSTGGRPFGELAPVVR
jgi:hypothetical protein